MTNPYGPPTGFRLATREEQAAMDAERAALDALPGSAPEVSPLAASVADRDVSDVLIDGLGWQPCVVGSMTTSGMSYAFHTPDGRTMSGPSFAVLGVRTAPAQVRTGTKSR